MKFNARCEFCGEFLSEEGYYSLSNCNETGKGVFLCRPCCEQGEAQIALNKLASERFTALLKGAGA